MVLKSDKAGESLAAISIVADRLRPDDVIFKHLVLHSVGNSLAVDGLQVGLDAHLLPQIPEHCTWQYTCSNTASMLESMLCCQGSMNDHATPDRCSNHCRRNCDHDGKCHSIKSGISLVI